MKFVSSLLNHSVDDPAAWYGPALFDSGDWIYSLSNQDIIEIENALSKVCSKPVRQIQKSDFHLPSLGSRLAKIKNTIDKGLGITLIKGLPVDSFSVDDAARVLWGMGQHIGIPQPQDADKELLHHVRDTGSIVENNPNLRYYQTNAAQKYHNDGGDIVMLLCLRPAVSGGASQMVSAITVFNEIITRRPELAEVLQKPFFFDARGQQLDDKSSIQKVPIYLWHEGRLNALYKRPYIEFAQRFKNVPKLSQEQVAALDFLDKLCSDPEINITFFMEPGDIQVASNFSIFHARDAFNDSAIASEKRHMIRLWLGLPEGRALPSAFRSTREFGPLFDIRGRL